MIDFDWFDDFNWLDIGLAGAMGEEMAEDAELNQKQIRDEEEEDKDIV